MPSKLLPPPTQLLTDPKTGAVDEAWYRFFEAMPEMLDEDDMASDSAIAVPSQQSVKAYVDTEVSGIGMTVLATGTVTSEATLDISLGYSDYKTFKLILNGIMPDTDATELWLRFSDDDGVSYEADASDYSWTIIFPIAGGPFEATDALDSEIVVVNNFSNVANETGNFEITIFDPASALKTSIAGSGFYHYSVDGLKYGIQSWGTSTVNAASTHVRVMFSSGNIAEIANWTLIGIN